jgi:hypothetical protein
MKKLLFHFLFITTPFLIHAQIGLKAGLNFANVTKASSINNSSQTGFHAGILLAAGKGIVSSRTEVLFSKQGYNYASGSNSGTVNLNYIMLQQGMCINITRFFSLFGGAQTAYLINAKVDSSGQTNNPYSPYGGQFMSLYNRMDYGVGIGAEVHPVLGLLIGVKYNISLGKLYKSMETGQSPSFSSSDLKNNVVQLSVGWIFGNHQSKKK